MDFNKELDYSIAECSFGVDTIDRYNNVLHIKTFEGELIKVQLSINGYFIENDFYDSLSSLLMTKSPLYKSKFHSLLISKLTTSSSK